MQFLYDVVKIIQPYWQYLSIILGITFSIFGIKLLFQKKFVQKLRAGIWKQSKEHSFSEINSYHYDRYIKGMRSLLFGILLIIFAVVSI